MNKKELIDELARRTGFTKVDCAYFLDNFCETVSDALSKGDQIKIVNFGIFKTKRSAARTGKNFAKNTAFHIPPRLTTVFIPGKQLKNLQGEVDDE